MSGQTIIASSFHRVPLSEILEHDQCRVHLTSQPHLYAVSQLLNSSALPQRIRDVHAMRCRPPPLRVYGLRDVTVAANGMAFKQGGLVSAEDIWPSYAADWFGKNPEFFGEVQAAGPVITEPVFSIFHLHISFYGHFLLEVLPKVLVIRRLWEQGYDYPIALPVRAAPYCVEMIRALHPEARFLELGDGPLRVEQVLLPSMANEFYFYHPSWVSMLGNYASETANAIGIGAEKLYLPRNSLPGSVYPRTIVNEARIQDILHERGFVSIMPHLMTWREKVAVFASAHTLVGDYGSGLHNSVLSTSGTRVVAFNWGNHCQQRITDCWAQVLAILPPSDGVLRMPGLNQSIEPAYRINEHELVRTLNILGD